MVDGHRRVKALRQLGKSMVLAIVESQPIGEAESIQKALIANAQRKGLSPLATARAIKRLMDSTGWNVSDAATRLGFKVPKVTKLLAFLKLPSEMAEQLSGAGIGATTAYELSKVTDPVDQAEMARRVLRGDVTRDFLSGQVKRMSRKTHSKERATKSRFKAILGPGRSVSVSSDADTDLDGVISLLEDILSRARRARNKGFTLTTLSKMLRDEAKAGASSSSPSVGG